LLTESPRLEVFVVLKVSNRDQGVEVPPTRRRTVVEGIRLLSGVEIEEDRVTGGGYFIL
jgi:hypothetical protein